MVVRTGRCGCQKTVKIVCLGQREVVGRYSNFIRISELHGYGFDIRVIDGGSVQSELILHRIAS